MDAFDAGEMECGCHVGNQRRVESPCGGAVGSQWKEESSKGCVKLMGDKQEDHLVRLKLNVLMALDGKYRSGQALHGGFLLDIGVSGLLDAAIDEALDQVTYLLSLKELLGGTRSERK